VVAPGAPRREVESNGRSVRLRGGRRAGPVAGPWRGRPPAPRTVPPLWQRQLARPRPRATSEVSPGSVGFFSQPSRWPCSRRPGSQMAVGNEPIPRDRRVPVPTGMPAVFPLRRAADGPDASRGVWWKSPCSYWYLPLVFRSFEDRHTLPVANRDLQHRSRPLMGALLLLAIPRLSR